MLNCLRHSLTPHNVKIIGMGYKDNPTIEWDSYFPVEIPVENAMEVDCNWAFIEAKFNSEFC